jgi:hypothetical protein
VVTGGGLAAGATLGGDDELVCVCWHLSLGGMSALSSTCFRLVKTYPNRGGGGGGLSLGVATTILF